MLALAIGDDTSSSLGRRESIIDSLFDLPSMFQLPFLMYPEVLYHGQFNELAKYISVACSHVFHGSL